MIDNPAFNSKFQSHCAIICPINLVEYLFDKL